MFSHLLPLFIENRNKRKSFNIHIGYLKIFLNAIFVTKSLFYETGLFFINKL